MEYDALDEWLVRRLQGESLGAAELLAAHPNLDTTLREKLQRLALALDVTATDDDLQGPPEHVGAYRIVRQIGRGGQGVVYLAEDQRLSRRVALKVLSHPALRQGVGPDGRDPAARLKREAEATSRLNHPGICVVHELGRQGDLAWIAMRHVEGETLGQRIARAREAQVQQGRAEVLAVVALVEQAARALHAAHEAGIVHRDIKPGNIMVTPQGAPVILDFGLAQDADSDAAGLSLTGDVCGTPAYMSPEQLMPSLGRVDARTDVYSLGVTLYECLTLRRPYEAPTRERLLELIRDGVIPDARRENAAIPRDLTVILRAALDRDRERRFRTALDFAEDLRRLRAREPILARPAGPLLRLGRWVQRNPVLATATLGLFVALSTGLVITRSLLSRVENEKRVGDGQRLLAESGAQLAADPALALLLAIEGAQIAPGPTANNALLKALDPLRELRTVLPDASRYFDSVLSPDGRWMVIGSVDRPASVWDLTTGDRVAELAGHAGVTFAAAFSADSRRLATSTGEGVQVWETGSWVNARSVNESVELPRAMALDASGRRLALGSTAGTARLVDLDTGRAEVLDAGQGTVRVGFTADGARLVTSSDARLLRVWQVDASPAVRVSQLDGIGPAICISPFEGLVNPTGELALSTDEEGTLCLIEVASRAVRRRILIDATSPHSAAGFSPDGTRLLIGLQDGRLWLGDVEGGAKFEKLDGRHEGPVTLIRFSADGSLALTDSGQGPALVWATESRRQLASLSAPMRGILQAGFDVDGQRVITACADGSLRWWDLGEHAVQVSDSGVCSVDGDPAGGRVACVTGDGHVRLLDLASRTIGPELNAFRAPRSRSVPVVRAVFSRDREGSELLVAAHGDPTRVDVATGTMKPELVEPPELIAAKPVQKPGVVWDAQYSPDGRRLVTAAEDGLACEWDAVSGSFLRALRGHTQGIRSVDWSGDGLRIVTASEHEADSTLRVWNADTGDALAVFKAEDGVHPMFARLDRDGSHAFAACSDGVLRVWDVHRPDAPPLLLRGHQYRSQGLDLSLDGQQLVSASEDRTVRLWDAVSGKELATLSAGGAGFAQSVAFSRDGRWIITGWQDGTVRIWPVDPLEEARRRKPRELTEAERRQYDLVRADGR